MAYFKQKIKMLFFMHTFARFDDDNGWNDDEFDDLGWFDEKRWWNEELKKWW